MATRVEDGADAADVVQLRVRSILGHVRQRRESLGSHHRATDGVFRPPILRVFCMHVEFWHGMNENDEIWPVHDVCVACVCQRVQQRTRCTCATQ